MKTTYIKDVNPEIRHLLRQTCGATIALEKRLNALCGRDWHRADIEQVLMSLHSQSQKIMKAWEAFGEKLVEQDEIESL